MLKNINLIQFITNDIEICRRLFAVEFYSDNFQNTIDTPKNC